MTRVGKRIAEVVAGDEREQHQLKTPTERAFYLIGRLLGDEPQYEELVAWIHADARAARKAGS